VCECTLVFNIYTDTLPSTCELHATAFVSCIKHLQHSVSPTIFNTYTLYTPLTMLQLTNRREYDILYTVGEADDTVRYDVRYDCLYRHDDDDLLFDVDLKPQ